MPSLAGKHHGRHHHAITVGQLIVFVEYIKGLQGPTRSLSKFMAKLTKTALRASKIVEILDEEPSVSDRPGATDPGPLRGHVQFQAVSGVSIDEESISLLNHQRSYQAAARYIGVIDEMLQKLISIA